MALTVVAPEPCFLCGVNPARGFASAWSPSEGEVWLCHAGASPTCYEKAERDRYPEWLP